LRFWFHMYAYAACISSLENNSLHAFFLWKMGGTSSNRRSFPTDQGPLGIIPLSRCAGTFEARWDETRIARRTRNGDRALPFVSFSHRASLLRLFELVHGLCNTRGHLLLVTFRGLGRLFSEHQGHQGHFSDTNKQTWMFCKTVFDITLHMRSLGLSLSVAFWISHCPYRSITR
jgi:hypothetical protein